MELTQRSSGGAIDIEVLKRKSWPGITAQFIRVSAPAMFDFKVPDAAICLALHDLYRVEGETSAAGVAPSFTKDLRHKLTYAPVGCGVEGWCRIDKAASFATVILDESVASRSSIDLAQHTPLVEFEDQMLRSLLQRFQAILDEPSLDCPGYAETLAELLMFELDRVSRGQAGQASNFSGLSARQFERVVEFMDAHLTDKLTVSELAALLNLTRFHFIRSFKQKSGMPPHRFLIHRKIDRAKEMLMERDTSVAEVAARTGFRSAMELARTFRRIVGVSPSTFRRECA